MIHVTTTPVTLDKHEPLPPRVTLVARTDSRTTGLARYVWSLYDSFVATGHTVHLVAPSRLPFPMPVYAQLAARGIDLETFFNNYPVRVAIERADVCHISSQNLATLLRLQRMPPTIVTVHDLYHLIARTSNQARKGFEQWADRVAVAGLKRAHALIAISQYTKQTIVDTLQYPAERITVIPRAVDLETFRPLAVPHDFRRRYELPADAPLVLYVGSEDPRKNLSTLIEAFARVLAYHPTAVLVKAGAVHFAREAAQIRERVQALGMTSNVRFIEHVPDDDLPLFYNAADLFVLPSRFEGFGLPALEAMACGRPVIAAQATSLPEVVGHAGVLFDPSSSDELADGIVRLLDDADQRRCLGEAARARAQGFSLTQQATRTWDVYCRAAEQAQARRWRSTLRPASDRYDSADRQFRKG